MKRKTISILVAVLLAAVFSFDACKKADVGTGTLTVIASAGVSGTPSAGTYTLYIGDQLAYGFILDAGYETLTVLLDGTEVAVSGTITISSDHTLKAYSDENGQYNLTVTVGTGVSGTPAAGTFTYPQGALVNYRYALTEGYTDLTVNLDETEVASSNTITMAEDHKISVSATAKKNIQGSWLLTETYDDDSSFAVTAAFSGNYETGTVADSDGGSGTYAVDDDQEATFNLVFPDVTYEYSGSFSDNDTMSGTCKRYQTSDTVISGTWTATRKTSMAVYWGNTLTVKRVKKGDRRPDTKE
jgi:hypothetical protein